MPDESRADTGRPAISDTGPDLSIDLSIDLRAGADGLEVRTAPGKEPLTSGDHPRSRAHAVPHGSRVLHIGAPKTGTTVVQGAIGAVAGLAREHGVHVPGTPNEQAKAGLSVLGQRVGWSQDPDAVSKRPWPRMAERIRAIEGTVFFSSEYLCEASPAEIDRIAGDLTGERGGVHVVLTLRPLEKVLPSAWQQYLKSGHRRPYDEWLRAVLAAKPDRNVTPSFWRRHDQAAVVERWAAGAGAANLSVVVLPPDDRGALFAWFEQLLALPAGTLRSTDAARLNRSMTAAEAELFRLVNVTLRDVELPWADYAHLMRYGAILRTVERPPAAGASPIETPAWAVERARELGAGFAERIDRLSAEGLRVVGSLDDLRSGATNAPAAVEVPATVEVEVAAQALLGALARASDGATWFDREGQLTTGQPGDVVASVLNTPAGRLTSKQLATLLARRVRESVERRARRLRR